MRQSRVSIESTTEETNEPKSCRDQMCRENSGSRALLQNKKLCSSTFPKLDQSYPFKEFPGLPKECFVCAPSISPHTTKVSFYNYSREEVILPKDYKLGYIELPVLPQYTPVKLVVIGLASLHSNNRVTKLLPTD